MENPSGTRNVIIAIFTASAFLTKLMSEVAHELLGHGLFVVLFGGQILEIHISMLWPYELSYIRWSLPALQQWESALVYGGGILITGLTSILLQLFIILRRPQWELSMVLAWFSFWCLMNAGGYLVIGGIYPFGDVAVLITLGVMSELLALSLGVVLFAISYFALSYGLLSTLKPLVEQWAPLGLIAMWSVVPTIVWAAMIGLGMFSLVVLGFGFIPLLLSFVISGILRMKFAKKCSREYILST